MNDVTLGRGGLLKTLLFYGLMVGFGIVAFLYIRSYGMELKAPAAPAGLESPGIAAHAQLNTLMHVLLALATIIVTARLVGAAFKFIQQPPVIGEVVGGILLGPSLLGRLAPDASAYILPQQVAPFLGIIAQLGVILYMFLVGMELDLSVIRRSGHATLAISHASILAPFLLGSALALWLYPVLSHEGVSFTVFALFLGVSLSVTAFPVLARILTDRGISRSPMGAVSLTCAAVDDATAWCLLALVVAIASAQPVDAAGTVLLTLVYAAFIIIIARPIVERIVGRLDRGTRISQSAQAVVLVAMLTSSLATEFIGIHAIFGAFLLGAIIPHRSKLARELRVRLEDVIAVLFLPAFFAFTGLRTQVGLLSGWDTWFMCGVIIIVACAGKFGGTLLAARLTGLGWRDSSALGILMNTRGLVELVVLNIGLDLGLITPKLFAMLVIMALVTTFMTTPILHLLLRRHPWPVEEEEDETLDHRLALPGPPPQVQAAT